MMDKVQEIRKGWVDKREEAYADYQFYQMKVGVYRVSFMDGSHLFVPKGVGEKIKNVMGVENSSAVVKLGEGVWRVYEFKSVVPASVRFTELSEWAKHKVLEEEPNLLDEWYDNFSPKLKDWVDRVRKGEDLDSDLRIGK